MSSAMFRPSDPTTSNTRLLPGTVSLEIPEKNRRYLTALQRHTVSVESTSAVVEAHRELQARGIEFGITAIEAITDIADGQSFLLSDLDQNWWEIAYVNN